MTDLENKEIHTENAGLFLTPKTKIKDFFKENLKPQVRQIFTEVDREDFSKKYIYHCTRGINLASTDESERIESANIFIDAILKALNDNIPVIVFHPGNGPIINLVKSLTEVADVIIENQINLTDKLILSVENMAGDYDRLLMYPEEIICLGDILADTYVYDECVKDILNLHITIDTAHAWSSGYYPDSFFLKVRDGILKIGAIHFNDSLKEMGVESDKHTWMGTGKIDFDSMENFLSLVKQESNAIGIPVIVEM